MTHILVVNDSQELLEIFRDILEGEGYKVTLHSSVIEDLAEIETIKPDLIILDIVFGTERVRSWDMLEKLKLNPSTESIPVIVCTAARDEVRQQQASLTSKGVLTLLKPFDIDDLLQSIQKGLQLGGS